MRAQFRLAATIIAFGALYPSGVKPDAVRATLDHVRAGRRLAETHIHGAPAGGMRRAAVVADALAAAGWPAPAFEVGGAGDQGAVTASDASEPLRRRTEVLVDAAPLN